MNVRMFRKISLIGIASCCFLVYTLIEFNEVNGINLERISSQETIQVPEINYNYTFIRYDENYKTKYPLPDWMEEFLSRQPTGNVEKHHDMLTDPSNKYIVMTCYKFDGHRQVEDCGGFTDRMFLLPYNIWLAHQTGRKLLIKYYKPRPLEEFLVPPPPADKGFNWMLPDGYFEEEWYNYGNRTPAQYKSDRRTAYKVEDFLSENGRWKNQRIIFINNNLAIPTTAMPSSWNFTREEHYGAIFRRFFQPSPELARQISLIPELKQAGAYASAHMRIKWPRPMPSEIRLKYTNTKWWLADKGLNSALDMDDKNTSKIITYIADHAVECAVRLMPETDYVYVSSDAIEAMHYLKFDSPYWSDDNSDGSPPMSWTPFHNETSTTNQTLNTTHEDIIISGQTLHGYGVPSWEIPTNAKILLRHQYNVTSAHFDSQYFENPVPSLYGTFVDLWVMAHAGAFSIDLGGFGRFASVLAGNQRTRRARHRDYTNYSPSCATSEERTLWKQVQTST
mmetsp:Transcript_8137/g.11623  ORF Transcript_8137/g.11623 Transcript_8137/m.11623 type:complete len:507 (-) Transcript_8137:117-1637(-)|eukprot:CAMPEP_0184862242 /NCGR_PEP_ID=MMETSP0580-20130426/6729_1 /TAXON_ID=1118495 /ORGANISM="Dactyliosolen fragilissimus" /LENGTH=506 /DNA_ID=CAMNT_0027360007 /DNA_START=41 /DNA_END=1561 /DNA_ORIENTATION=+